MKTVYAACFVIIFSLVSLLSGCNPNDETSVEPTPAVYVADTNAFINTGRLRVRIYHKTSKNTYVPVANPTVTLYATYSDYQNGISMARIVADESGRCDFGYLNFNTYYLQVYKEENGEHWENVYTAQVQVAASLMRNIVLY